MFTCISCRVAFETAAEQRNHFATDWHRYNMKRRVANLPPVPATAFNEKVIERREQNAVRIDPRDLFCAACSKSFSTDNAYKSHNQSRKHREKAAEQARAPQPVEATSSSKAAFAADASDAGSASEHDGEASDNDDDEEDTEIEERLAAARRRIQPSDCLFCPVRSKTIPDNLDHMKSKHSFYIPDRELLLDLPGLLSHLGEKVVLANLCLFCPNGGREFGDLSAVRKHMIDKFHCKLAYETDEDRAELADYYDFTGDSEDGSDWEEMEDEEMGVEALPSTSGITLSSDGLSLVLPSGRMLGHRSLKTYYAQRLRPPTADTSKKDLVAAKVRQVRLNLADPTQALVPVAGGHGAYGRGLEVMKARNAGEAKWAKRQAGAHLEQRKREAFKTRVGYVHNNQKHFRDPLLQ